MKRMIKRIFLPMFAVILICSVSKTAFAAEALPDPERNGSISITMKDTGSGAVVPGGSVMLYQVADAVIRDGNCSFQFTDAFSECGLSLEDIQSDTLASGLAVYGEKHKVSRIVQEIQENGTVSFQGLIPGLYLVVQQMAAEGYHAMSPFLVSVPVKAEEDGRWIYDVDASPKMEVVKREPASTDPVDSTDPAGTMGTYLPQTGQLNWPVPVMSIAGVLLFALGWTLNSRKEEEAEEGS